MRSGSSPTSKYDNDLQTKGSGGGKPKTWEGSEFINSKLIRSFSIPLRGGCMCVTRDCIVH